MGQFTWMFSIIPDAVLNWVYWAIIALGVTGMFAGWFGKFIPMYGRYIGFIKPVGIALVILGVWLRGGYDTELAWRAKVSEAEAKIKVAEEKSAGANTKIQTKIVERVKVIHDTQVVVQEKIVKDSAKIDATCTLDPIVVEDLNQAAGGKKK
jgi:uncharacterized membrane protein